MIVHKPPANPPPPPSCSYAAFQKHYPSAEAVAAPPADPALPCGEPLPVLVNVLGEYPADPQQEYAFQVEPFAPVVTFVKVSEGCGVQRPVVVVVCVCAAVV